MVQQLTLEDYLKSDPNVIVARAKLQEAKLILDEAGRALRGSKFANQDVINDLKKLRAEAAKKYNSVLSVTRETEKTAENFFKKNYSKISTEVYSKTITNLEKAKKQARLPGQAEEIQRAINDLKQAIANPKPYVEKIPKIDTKKESKDVAQTQEDKKVQQKFIEEINNDIVVSGQYVAELSGSQRKILAQELNKVYNLNLPIDGLYSPELKAAYQKALYDRQARSIDFNRNISLAEFLTVAAKEGTYKGKGGGLRTTIDTDVDITRRTAGQVDADINEIAVKVLGRNISEEDKAEDWYGNLVSSINKMYEKGTKTVTTSTTRGRDGRTVSGTKRVVTPSVAEADIDALIERRLRKNDPESVGRKERLDFVSWLNKSLGD
jgi:hypothetical protein